LEDLKGTDHLEELDVDGITILEFILEKNRVRWYKLDAFGSGYGSLVDLVNTVMNRRVPQEAVSFLISWATISISRTVVHEVS